jgi:uncharacterized membrane protein YqaE (UPF0057 family)
MKLKSILSISSVFMLLAILVSSCGSTLNITKKRHSSGYYVNIGSDNHSNTNKAEKNKKGSISDLVENKINNDGLIANLEGSNNIDGKNDKNSLDLKNQNLSAEQLAAAEFSKMSTLKKIKALKKLKKAGKLDDNSDFMLILLVLLSLILSPIAVFLKGDGVSTHFWINLIMWLFGIGFAGLFAGSVLAILGLLWLVAVVHALLYVFGVIS